MSSIFPELEGTDWRQKHEQWRRIRGEVIGLELTKQHATGEDLEAIESLLTLRHMELAALSPPERFMWYESVPFMDKWAVAAESSPAT